MDLDGQVNGAKTIPLGLQPFTIDCYAPLPHILAFSSSKTLHTIYQRSIFSCLIENRVITYKFMSPTFTFNEQKTAPLWD